MVKAFLIKYSEIGIKGKNRYIFEDALRDRVIEKLARCEGEFLVEKENGRIYVEAKMFRYRAYLSGCSCGR